MRIILAIYLFLLITTGYSQDKPWSSFDWVSYTVADRTFDKAAILIPVKFEGVPRTLWMQFDTGANATTVYEIPFKQLNIPTRYATTDSSTIILSTSIGNYSFDSLRLWVSKGFGDSLTDKDEHPIIGTIGQDILASRVFILDFPQKRFCLLSSVEEIPNNLLERASFVNLNHRNNKLFITIQIADTSSDDFFFDTGSSIFPVATTPKLWQKFTGLKGDEEHLSRLKVSSWGREDIQVGARARGALKFGNLLVQNPMIYFDSTGLNDFTKWPFKADGLIGNQVFYDDFTVIIDLIKNRFGILKNK